MLLVRTCRPGKQKVGPMGMSKAIEAFRSVNRQGQKQTNNSQLWLVPLSQFESIPAQGRTMTAVKRRDIGNTNNSKKPKYQLAEGNDAAHVHHPWI
jgi:hypothetical protein